MVVHLIRTTNGFDTISLPDFGNTLNTITGKMSGNKNFVTLADDVKKLNEESGTYLTLAQKAVKGGSEAMIARDNQRAVVVKLLHTMGNNVTAISDGDLAIMESSGFPYTKSRKPSPPLTEAAAPKVQNGLLKKQIKCKAKRQKGCLPSIVFMITSTPELQDSWKTFVNAKVDFTFTNLQSGVEYSIKYMLNGPRNQHVESPVVTFRPQ